MGSVWARDYQGDSESPTKGLFTWKEGALGNRATRLEGLKLSPPLHATHPTGTVSGLREFIS